MRCYFMRDGHIASVEVLEGISDDAAAIKKASTLFLDRVPARFDGFEVWERDRLVFRYPDDDTVAGPATGNGKSSSPGVPSSRGKKGAPGPIASCL